MTQKAEKLRSAPRWIAAAFALLVLGGLSGPAASSASTTLGDSVSDPFQNCPEGAGDNLVQPLGGPPGATSPPFAYTVPGTEPVVFTRWTHAGAFAPSSGSGKLIIWRPTANPKRFTVVGKSESVTFTPSTTSGTAIAVTDIPTRIRALPGDVLGLRAESDDVLCFLSHQADGFRSYNGPDPEVGSTQTFGPAQAGRNVNVTATFEPDADDDGFGDETQDFCVGVNGPDNGCPLPPPEAGETANLEQVTGTIRVKLPGSNMFITIDDAANVPVGTIFDTRRGELRLKSETKTGSIRAVNLSRGSFRLLQSRSDGFITELKLTPISGRSRRRAPVSANVLLANAFGRGGGGHKTTGKHGSGSVRGTKWLTSELRAGTRFDVLEGQVRVTDFELGRTVLVKAGESYLARGK